MSVRTRASVGDERREERRGPNHARAARTDKRPSRARGLQASLEAADSAGVRRIATRERKMACTRPMARARALCLRGDRGGSTSTGDVAGEALLSLGHVSTDSSASRLLSRFTPSSWCIRRRARSTTKQRPAIAHRPAVPMTTIATISPTAKACRAAPPPGDRGLPASAVVGGGGGAPTCTRATSTVGCMASVTPVPLLSCANHTRSIVVASVSSKRVAATAAAEELAMRRRASTWTLAEDTVRTTSSLAGNWPRSADANPSTSKVSTSPLSTKLATTMAL